MEELTARHFREGNPRCSSTGARRSRNGAQYLRRSSAGRTEAGGGSEGSLDKCCQEDEARAKALDAWVPMLVCCGVQKFWASSLLSSKPTGLTPPKPPSASVKDRKRSPRCWPTRARQGQRTSIGPAHTTNKSCWRGQRVHGKGCQILTQRRRPCKQPLPGSAAWPRMLRPPSCLRCCGWDGAPSLPGISPPTMARRSTSWVLHHRPWATGSTRQLWSGQTVPHIGATPKGRFSGRQSDPCWLLGNWKDGPSRTEMCWSSWSHTASGHRTGSPGFEVGTTFASFATRAQARSTSDRLCRESGTFAPRRSCGRRRARWSRNTEQFARGCFPCPSQILPMGARQLGRAHLHRRILVGQWHSAARRLGCGRRRQFGKPQVGGLRSGTSRRPHRTDFARRRGLRCDFGWSDHDGPAHPATARAPSRLPTGRSVLALGAKGKRVHVWSSLFCSHDEVTAVKVNGHATEADVQAGRSTLLFRHGNNFADVFAKEGADTRKPPLHVAKTYLARSSLAKQALRWAAEAHVVLRSRGWSDTLGTSGPKTRVRRARTRAKRKRGETLAVPAAGQAADRLALFTPASFSHNSELDTRSFGGNRPCSQPRR